MLLKRLCVPRIDGCMFTVLMLLFSGKEQQQHLHALHCDETYYMTYKEKTLTAWSTENMFGFVLLWHAILACTNLSVAHFNLISRKQMGQTSICWCISRYFNTLTLSIEMTIEATDVRTHSNWFQRDCLEQFVPLNNVLVMELCGMWWMSQFTMHQA